MAPNFPIEPPEDFERNTILRAWVSTMPQVSVPNGFEESVLLRVHRTVMPLWQKLTIAAIGCSVVLTLGYFFLFPRPEIVTVVRVPELTSQTVDLYNLPPAPVHEMPEISGKPKTPPVSAVTPRKRHGVAGY
jgi:hypothetical protein